MTETNGNINHSWKEASASLQKALLSINASGTDGFEGAIAHALSEFTGLAFGVVKSGPQGGVDGLSKLASNHIHVGYEGKRYRESTKLRLDELKSKIVDAIDNHPRLDLWILATTRHLAANDIQELEDYANSQGIEALVLDWTKGARPPDLAIIFANTPKTLEHHFANDDSLLKQMQGLRKDVALVSDRERLRDRLMGPSVGFDAARNAARSFLEKNLSDEATARHTFDSDAAIAAKDVKRVRRPQINSQLSDWWQSPDKTIAALLGGEGTGKTWAGISWWYDNLRTSDEAPLTLILPARDADSRDGPTLIARALTKAFPARNEQFWARRVRSWSQDGAHLVSFLLVFDGLDQKWMKDDWDDLFISFLTPDWRDKAKLVVSCRPDHWQSELGGLSTLPQRPKEIAIGDFDDDELDELLSLHGLARDDFTKPLLTLIKKPRLSRIAIKRRSELMRSGDVTPERLIYEDWQSRRPIAQRKMSHERFVSFISKLGREAQDALEEFTLSRRDLLDRIGEPDGRTPDQVRHLLGELIDSEWLEPAGNIDQFKLDADRAPAVLALTLLDDVRDASVASEIESRLAELFDPMGGSDFGVKILRHAVTFALLDGSTSRLLRMVLLERWLTSQNFSNEDFQSFWRIIGCDPDLIIDFAETEWFGPEPTGRIDEVLCKGLGNSFKWPEVQGPLKGRLLSWFSRYWLDPLEGEILGEVPNDQAAQARRARTQERAANALEAGLADKFRLNLQEVTPARQAWGCYRGVELLSWLPRLPLVDVYTAWALSRAIMDGHRQFDAMAWNLRWFPDDEFEDDAIPAIEELKHRAQELIGSQNEVGVAAGATIFRALDLPHVDVGLIKESRSDRSVASCDEDPEEWQEVKPGPRFERSPLDEVIFLSADPFDPYLALQKKSQERLVTLTHRLSLEQIRGRARDSSDGGLSNARLKLARWAPFELARLLSKRHSKTEADPKKGSDLQTELEPVSEEISSALLLLSDDVLDGWTSQFSTMQSISENLEAALVSLRGKSSNFQIDVLARFPADTKLPKWANLLLSSPSPEDHPFLTMALSSSTDEPRLLFWLRYLDLFAKLTLPKNWEPLKELIGHPNADVRSLAFRLVDRIEDRELADALFNSGWRSETAESREESAYGTLALCHSSFASTGEIAKAVHPNWLGHLTQKYPEQYIEAFADHVREELDHFLNARSRTFPRSLFHVEEGWDELIKRKSSEFKKWMAPVVKGKKSVGVFSFGFTERFPLYACVDAYEKIEPGTKARLLAAAIAPEHRGVMRVGEIYYQITSLDGEGSDKAKRIALDEADNDQKLFDFAIGLQQHDQNDWLFDLIFEEISSEIPARAARGVTLAAFLAPSERADELFLDHLAAVGGRKWLKSVRDEAHQIYRRACHSAHWRQTFFSANTDEEAFAAFELFAESVDRRLFINDEIWRSRFRETTKARRLHWDINAERLKEQTKKASKPFEKTFLLTKPPMRNQAPKMR